MWLYYGAGWTRNEAARMPGVSRTAGIRDGGDLAVGVEGFFLGIVSDGAEDQSAASNGESGSIDCPIMKSLQVLSLSKSKLIKARFFGMLNPSWDAWAEIRRLRPPIQYQEDNYR